MRNLNLALCAAMLAVAVTPAFAGDDCTCGDIQKTGQGFCMHCKKGMIYGVELTSDKLYDVLAGEDGMVEELKNADCNGCKNAAKTNGHCQHCGIYVAADHVFLSKPAWELAMGQADTEEPVAKMIKGCPGCADASKKNGFCTGCDMGFVGHHAYKTKSVYDGAVKAFAVFADAVKDSAKCETCAFARMSDSKCRACNVTFKDGKPVS